MSECESTFVVHYYIKNNITEYLTIIYCSRKKFLTVLKQYERIILIIFFEEVVFVCSGFIVPLENVSLIWRRHHCRRRCANFDLCSALMAIEQ